jgi:hypothetical protein
MQLSGPGASSPRELASGVPQLLSGRIFLLTLVLLTSWIGGLEAYWRSQGFLPNVPDSVGLWSFWRTRIYEPRGNVLVFLGTSRIRADVDLDTLAHTLPAFRSVQLGVSGDVSPMGTLQSLALDPHFHGVVICELAAPFLERARWDDQKKFFRQPLGNGSFEELACAYLRGKVATLHHRLTIGALVRQLWSTDAVLAPPRCHTCFDRSLCYNAPTLSDGTLDDGHQLALQKTVDPRSLMEGVAALRESVLRIQTRHGSVVFVGLPASTPDAEMTDSGFKNNVTWSRLAELTGAICVPLETRDSVGSFHCSDSVHLDRKQATRLTQRLIAELRRNRVVE